MVEWTLREAVAADVPAIIVVVSPAQPEVREYIGALRAGDLEHSPGPAGSADPATWLHDVEIHFVVQPEPTGIGDALVRCRELTGDDAFGVLLPDNWFDAEDPPLSQVEKGFRATGMAAIGLVEVTPEDRTALGNVGGVTLESLSERTHRIRSLQDKGEGSFEAAKDAVVLRGCARYVVGPDLYDALDATGPPDEGEWDDVPAFQRLVATTGLVGRRIEGRFFDVGQKAGYAAAAAYAAAISGSDA